MSILDRTSLEQSSLADLHAIASELSIDSFRRLRKAELIDAILARQTGAEPGGGEELIDAEEPASDAGDEPPAREQDAEPQRRRRLRRRRKDSDEPEAGGDTVEEETPVEEAAVAAEDEGEPEPEPSAPAAEEPERPADRQRGDRQRGDRERGDRERGDRERAYELAEGVVEVLPGGSGFVRVNPPEPSNEDVYVSAAQVRRCELVTGDRVSGPRRPPRRSERFASLVRVETVNGQPASEVADGGRFEELPVAWPSVPLPLPGGDPTLAAIMAAAPIGRGSRVTVAGPAQSGKTEILRRVAAALADRDDFDLRVALVGARPEEIAEWAQWPAAPSGPQGIDASLDARSQAVEAVIEQARRLAVRGSHTIVLIDTLDAVSESTARKAMAAARTIVDAGSVTVIAAATHPLGGETTVIALSPALAAAGRWPALDVAGTWTMRPDHLVGEWRATEIARQRAQALGS